MSHNIKYKELQLKIAEGITLIVDVTSKDDIKAVLDDLAEFDISTRQKLGSKVRALSHSDSDMVEDSPEKHLEVRAGLGVGNLRVRNILAFKDEVPQLLRPGSFNSISDAMLTLIFAVEAGLKKSAISFDDFKTLYDAQNIKSGSQLSMLLNNLKNSGYIDKGQYNNNRTIRLTAKGEKKAAEVLNSITP
jgi:hypothetical protein